MINFQTFQHDCKHAQYGLKEGTVREFVMTCRRPDCIPKGHSWGVCDEAHCPHFGINIDSGVMIDANTGKTLLTFNGGRFVFGG